MTASAKLDALITETKARGARSIYVHEDSSSQRAVTDFCVARIQAAGLLAIQGVHVIGSDHFWIPTTPAWGATCNLRDSNWPNWNERRSAVLNLLSFLQYPAGNDPQCIWWFGFDACSDTELREWLVAQLAKIPTPARYPGQPEPQKPVEPEKPTVTPPPAKPNHGHVPADWPVEAKSKRKWFKGK